MKVLRKRYGRAAIPKHLRDFSRDIVNALMRGTATRPFDLAQRFGLSTEDARAIYDLASHAFGPGGAGFDWAVEKTAAIVRKKR
jgi:hypothetical protein